jgi:hypothetical protein
VKDNREKVLRSWAKLLNPESLRSNLIAASIFLAAYEILRESVINRIQDFFTQGFDENGWIIGKDYETKVLALDKSPLRSSLLWLKGMDAIDEADLAQMDRIREHRNELAHDLPKFLGSDDAEINIQLLSGIHELIAKVDRWWIREVEMTTNPDFAGREVADEEIVSGNMLFIHLMLRIATGDDAGALWKEFQKGVDK